MVSFRVTAGRHACLGGSQRTDASQPHAHSRGSDQPKRCRSRPAFWSDWRKPADTLLRPCPLSSSRVYPMVSDGRVRHLGHLLRRARHLAKDEGRHRDSHHGSHRHKTNRIRRLGTDSTAAHSNSWPAHIHRSHHNNSPAGMRTGTAHKHAWASRFRQGRVPCRLKLRPHEPDPDAGSLLPLVCVPPGQRCRE